jgi:hypothetical protein
MAANVPTPEDYKRMQAEAKKLALEENVALLVDDFKATLEHHAEQSSSDTVTMKVMSQFPAVRAAFQAKLEAAGWQVTWKLSCGQHWIQVTPKTQKAPERLFH